MSAPKSGGLVTVAIALPIIAFVAILILCLVFIRRRVQKQTQQLEDGVVWERGPLIMVNRRTIVHKDSQWSMPRKPTLRVPFLSWSSHQQPEKPAIDPPSPSTRSSEESFISIHQGNSSNDTNDPALPETRTGNPRVQSTRSGSIEATNEYASSLGHEIATAVPRLAVRIPQWPAWLSRWPSPAPSRKESSSQGHSPSNKSDEPFSHLKLEPPRIVRLEPSFLREYRPVSMHAHTESTTSLISSPAPPGMSDGPTPAQNIPPSVPFPLTHARHDSTLGQSAPPSHTLSIPDSLLVASRRPSVAPSLSSSVIARFPHFGDIGPDPPSESPSRTSTVPSEFAEGGHLPNPFASSASPWRAVLAAVGEAGAGEVAEGQEPNGSGVVSLEGHISTPTTPGSPLPHVRSQHAFHAMPLRFEPSPEERPASTAASRAHGRTTSSGAVTLSSRLSQPGSGVLTPNPSYSTSGSVRT